MECYPCLQSGRTREAAGLCHHCSAALCQDHICEVEDPIIVAHLMARTVVLPRKARLLLCVTCKAALEQLPSELVEVAGYNVEAPGQRLAPTVAALRSADEQVLAEK